MTNINSYLTERSEQIVNKWLDYVIATYPVETGKFLKNQKDKFANPVGANLHKDLEVIFAQLLKEQSGPELDQAVDGIVRVRAIQDFVPSQAVALFMGLKNIVREELNRIEDFSYEQLLLFEGKIDRLCLLSFDIYMKCREKVWELKAKEAQNRTKNLLRKRAGVDWTTS